MIVCPNAALAPVFRAVQDEHGNHLLLAQGNGRRECFGYVYHAVHLEAGKTYRMRVKFRVDQLHTVHFPVDDVNRHLVHGVFAGPPTGFNDGIFEYRKVGDWIIGENRFPGPAEPADAHVRLYFRFSPHGQVWWDQVTLQECEPIPPRLVTIACSWGKGDLSPGGDLRDFWGRWLDAAGERHVDVALLPEAYNGKNPPEAEPLDGPSGRLLADKARQWRMYVSASFYERRGDLVLNTAPLYDRNGQLVGAYSKNQLYDPELDQGVTPGVGFPVFTADFGRIGIIICYDSWFPEPVRLLAYQGADLILFPNAGYYAGLMPARAADNGVWIATSSLNCPAGIWDPGGAQAGELAAEPTRYAPCTIRAFARDEGLRMLQATVDVSHRVSPHWWGGPMLSAPGGRRVRQTLIEGIENAIAAEAGRWYAK
jgi:predicted amidohydrolase